MGKGRGVRIRKTIAQVFPGKFIFELRNINENIAHNFLYRLNNNISIKLKFAFNKKSFIYDKYRNTFKMY